MRSNPRRLNFILACGAVLQKYDAEHDEAQREQMQAAVWGVGRSGTSKSPKPAPTNGQKQTMTARDIMRNYGK